MNVAATKELVEKNQVVTLKADKSKPAPEVDELLVQLGNKAQLIPQQCTMFVNSPTLELATCNVTVQLHVYVQVNHAQSLGLDAKANTDIASCRQRSRIRMFNARCSMYRKAARAETKASLEVGACTENIAMFSKYIGVIEKPMASDIQLFYRRLPQHMFVWTTTSLYEQERCLC